MPWRWLGSWKLTRPAGAFAFLSRPPVIFAAGPVLPSALSGATYHVERGDSPFVSISHFLKEVLVMQPFASDIKKIRDRARQHISEGAVTGAYKADREQVIKVLNEALATEIVCVLRYKRHYFMASGINSDSVKEEFLQHAAEEQGHADSICTRIVQLNGEPNLNPEGLATRSHSEYAEGTDLASMIKEDLIAERIAIETYSEIVRWLGDADMTSRRLMEQILEKEEEHAEDMASLLAKTAGK
jgi:bacterioferritin